MAPFSTALKSQNKIVPAKTWMAEVPTRISCFSVLVFPPSPYKGGTDKTHRRKLKIWDGNIHISVFFFACRSVWPQVLLSPSPFRLATLILMRFSRSPQVLNYAEPNRTCKFFRDLDLTLLQFVALSCGAQQLVNHILHKCAPNTAV